MANTYKLQHYLVITWLLPHVTAATKAHVLCKLYNHTPVYSMTSYEATYIRHNVGRDACVFSCNWPPALLAEGPASFTCYCSNMRVEQIPKQESAQKVDLGEENSPAALTGLEPATSQLQG